MSEASALRAYGHAREAQRPARHHVDVVDELVLDYGTSRRRPVLCTVRQAQPGSSLLAHKIAEPTATAFKVGFGFAAGAALFRLVVGVSGLLVLLLLAAITYSMLE